MSLLDSEEIKTEPLDDKEHLKGLEISIEDEVKQESTDLADIKEEVQDPKSFSSKSKLPYIYCICPTFGCGVQFVNATKLKQHIADCHAFKEPTKSPYQVKTKYYTKNASQQFFCQKLKCNGKFDEHELLMQHMQACHQDNASTIRETPPPTPELADCYKATKKPIHFQVRTRRNREQKFFVCLEPGCRGYFTDLTLLKKHIVACHDSQIPSDYKQKFECTVCKAAFDFKVELKQHIKDFHNSNTTCPDCKKVFISAFRLEIHQTKCVKCKCEICEMWFCTKQSYYKHKKTCKANKIKGWLDEEVEYEVSINI